MTRTAGLVGGVCRWILLGIATACAAPVVMAPVDRQDPQRFESCSDPEGRAAYEQALSRLQAGDDAGAVPLLQTVVSRCPEHVQAMAYYQDAAIHVGGETEAEMRSFYSRLGDDRDSPVPAFAKARLLESNFARKGAVDELLRRHPDFAWAWLAQGRLNRGIGRLQDAAESFQRAIARHPKLLPAHVELAECLTELGRTAEAQVAYENYLRAAPNDRGTALAYVQLVLYRLGQPDAARPWIERLLAEDPLDESVRMDLAACDWRAQRLDAALAGYLEVLQRRPDSARAALNIGYLHFDAFPQDEAQRRQHWPKARAAFQLFQQVVRPADGYDYFERTLAVPFRLKQIEALLGPSPERAPEWNDLR